MVKGKNAFVISKTKVAEQIIESINHNAEQNTVMNDEEKDLDVETKVIKANARNMTNINGAATQDLWK